MTNTDRHPAISRDAKAWRDAAGVKHTEALRLIEDPLHQGILGDRIVVRDLLRVLEEHPIIGSRHSSTVFGRRGLMDDEPMVHELSADLLRETLLAVEFLRMFTPVSASDQHERNEVGSYTLKHMAEELLGRTVGGYLPNGALIWAAAVLGLPIRESGDAGESRNVTVYLLREEVDFMRAGHPVRIGRRNGAHFQPPGHARLTAVIERASNGDPFDDELTIPVQARPAWSPFHVWLSEQSGRDGFEGRFASDYLAGVNASDHRPAASGKDLLEILRDVRIDPEFLAAAKALVAEYEVTSSRG
ncbi:hypothetical protein [Microbacterium sp. Nx66]|uniref:hypothetical protein n=1 Tax=Microbacterium sp. Nx66 TaxID=2766784 RepID=UPI00165727E7|nr:hypothetical protein [Microbacterium sp. Nx66]